MNAKKSYGGTASNNTAMMIKKYKKGDKMKIIVFLFISILILSKLRKKI